MKTKFLQTISILALVLVILATATAVSGSIAKSNLAKQHPAPGQLVDVGGYKLHINCIGQGSPTVLLEGGLGEYSLTWAHVQPGIAQNTRVCAYDRAGYGWSEVSPDPRTAVNEVEELHRLLVNANIQGPYLLVGHSLGGMLVRMYAKNYPDEVAGMVLVDSMHEALAIRFPNSNKVLQEMTGQLRLYAFLSSSGIMALAPQNVPNPGLPDEAYAQYQAVTATSGFFKTFLAELDAIEASSTEARALDMTSFGDMPLIVLSAGKQQTVSSFTEAENQKLWEEMQALQSELADHSSTGKQIVAEQSGHDIQLEQPDLVVDAIREMLAALRE